MSHFTTLVFLTSLAISSAFLQPQPSCPGCPTCQNANGCGGEQSTTTSAAEESTTEEAETTTGFYEQYWQSNGWKTDDAGNVYVGDDNAKLLLIQMGSYCPTAICKGWFGIW